MATAPVLDLQPTGTDIVAAVASNPGIVLFEQAKFNAWYESLKANAPAPGDMAKKKDRDALRSYSSDVRSEKAKINKDRLRLTSEWRDLTAKVNASWKDVETQLDELAVDVRKPLTEWEEAEEARVAECRDQIDSIHIAAIIAPEDTAATVRDRGMMLWQIAFDPAKFGDMLDEAKAAKEQGIAALKRARDRLTQEEADRAELARLRAENEAREAREREENEARERQEREAAATRQAEERRVAAERADAERIAAAEKAAEERARHAAERAAQEERDRVQREHDAALAAERAKREKAERERQKEAARIAAEEAARAAEAKRVADEQAEREANKAHRTRVKRAAKEAMMTCGASEDAAQKIVLAIIAGEVPAVTLRF